jgi:hypothetical protein
MTCTPQSVTLCPVIQALTEATIGKPAQLSAQPSPLRSSSIASSQGIISPVTDPSVVAAQPSELRQFREFLSQLSPNAALFSQLLEQVLYDYRSDTYNQIGGFSLSPGPLQKGSHVHLSSLRRQAQGMQVLGCHYTTPVTDVHIPLLPPVGASQTDQTASSDPEALGPLGSKSRAMLPTLSHVIRSSQTVSLTNLPISSPHHSVRLQAHRQVQVRPATAPQGMASSSQVIHTSQHCCPHKQLLCLSGCHLTKGEGGTSIPICVEQRSPRSAKDASLPGVTPSHPSS